MARALSWPIALLGSGLLLINARAYAAPPSSIEDDGLGGPQLEDSGQTIDDKSELASEQPRQSAATSKASTPMHRRFGFGAMRTLSAANGLWLEYFAGRSLSLGLLAGFATFAHRETDDNGEFKKKKIVGMLATGPSVMYWPAKLQANRAQAVYADVGIGGRALVYWGFRGDDGDDAKTLDVPLEVDLEVPIALRIFFGKNVCITPEFGFAARWIPGTREPDQNGDFDKNPGSGVGEKLGTTNGPGLGFELGNHTGLFFGLSIGYFFAR